jgi:FkbM family methyltransferase
VTVLLGSPLRQLAGVVRGRRPGPASIAGETFLLSYPFSRFQAGPEAPILSAFKEAVVPGAMVFDVGANAGIYSLLAARRGAQVVAFEPSAEAAQMLRRHVALNGLESEITVVEAVVADEEGVITFYEQGAASTSSISEASARTGEEFLDDPVVPTNRPSLTLDGYCEKHSLWPDVAKVDVEGAELRVLAGAKRWLERGRGVLILEVHPWSLAQLGATEANVLALLDDARWTAALVADNGNTRHYRCELLTSL